MTGCHRDIISLITVQENHDKYFLLIMIILDCCSAVGSKQHCRLWRQVHVHYVHTSYNCLHTSYIILHWALGVFWTMFLPTMRRLWPEFFWTLVGTAQVTLIWWQWPESQLAGKGQIFQSDDDILENKFFDFSCSLKQQCRVTFNIYFKY